MRRSHRLHAPDGARNREWGRENRKMSAPRAREPDMPLFACFPVCLTFAALGVLGLLVLVTGLYSRGLPQEEPEESGAPPVEERPSGRPPLWVVLLIFAAVLIHFVVALWLWPEL